MKQQVNYFTPNMQVQTEHCVDDPSPADVAMEELRRRLPMLSYRIRVSEDGKTMTFTREDSRFAKWVEDKISNAAAGLPLTVERDTWTAEPFNHLVFQDSIIVKYTGKP